MSYFDGMPGYGDVRIPDPPPEKDMAYLLAMLSWFTFDDRAIQDLFDAVEEDYNHSVEPPEDVLRAGLEQLRYLKSVLPSYAQEGKNVQDALTIFTQYYAERLPDEFSNPGAFGPSLDYSNPPEGGIPEGAILQADFDEMTSFNIETCNHTELPPEVRHEVEAMKEEGAEIGANPPDPVVDEAFRTEMLVDDPGNDGLLPVPARFPEIYECEDQDEESLGDFLKRHQASTIHKVDFRPAEYTHRLAANPRRRFEGVHASYLTSQRLPLAELYKRNRDKAAGPDNQEILLSAQEIGVGYSDLLATNPKLEKGLAYRFLPLGLSLSPAVMSGLKDVCPYKSKGCYIGCLNDSGITEVMEKAPRNKLSIFRKRRTLLFLNNPALFLETFDRALQAAKDNPTFQGFKICCRLNVLSDLAWETGNYFKTVVGENEKDLAVLMNRHPDVEFYDYTKDTKRMYRYLMAQRGQAAWPKNYQLTFSWSEINAAFAFWVLDNGGNVAVAFDTRAYKVGRTPLPKLPLLPKWWCGYRVIDGDISDLRFLDNTFFSDAEVFETVPAMRDLTISGRHVPEDTIEVSEQIRQGTGLIVGLRLKGRKFRSTVAAARKVEDGFRFDRYKRGYKDRQVPVFAPRKGERFPATTCSGGFVQYASDAGMRNEDRVYDPSLNKTFDPSYRAGLIALSEQRRLTQFQEVWKTYLRGTWRERKGFVGIAKSEEHMLKELGYIEHTIDERVAMGESPMLEQSCDPYMPPQSRAAAREQARQASILSDIEKG